VRTALHHSENGYSLNQDLQRVLQDRAISTVVDIGAHHGLFGQHLRASGYTGKILSIEPTSAAFEVLQGKLDADWSAERLAVSTEEGTVELKIFDGDGQLNSLLPASELGSGTWEMHQVGKEEVRALTLQGLVQQRGLDPERTLVKIDAQGLDFAILQASASTVDAIAALLIEVPMFGLYEGAAAPGVMIDWLRARGLNAVGFYPVHDHPRPLIPVEFDGLFARSEDLG